MTKPAIPSGATCDHTQMAECHPGCGHWSCPCGITWDEGAEGSFDWPDEVIEALSAQRQDANDKE